MIILGVSELQNLVKKVLVGNRRAIAQAISLVENHPDKCADFIGSIFHATGNAFIVGITGPPGSGKSTLINNLTVQFRNHQKTVGVIAVDPTSPFSGGALLGDRIRMDDVQTDPGVFIRSMGSRGSLGGLSRATMDAIRVLDASGYDIILVETVGAGQSEVEIVRTAHCCCVLGIPGTGDAVQAIKAGIMEIADIYVVNKSDRPGAQEIVNELKLLLSIDPSIKEEEYWKIPVISTSSEDGTGITELAETILKFNEHLKANQDFNRERELTRRKYEILEILKVEFFENILDNLVNKQKWEEILNDIMIKKTDPYTAAKSIMDPFLR
jgi:LAO/AO transport system kinase